ncbi:MAG TPA: deoxynucleoside kinase, partial [Trichococcus flocculiformis]|nr:deoxynucleoside kinase [Trichococcus flocculiformis]
MLVMAGMIGAGKSTYTEMISRRLGTEAFFESVDYNPILDKFYDNPQKWAFSLQIYFLNTRFRSIKAALTDDNNVLDRSIYEDALFTRVNHLQGNISQEEMDIYNDLLANMME